MKTRSTQIHPLDPNKPTTMRNAKETKTAHLHPLDPVFDKNSEILLLGTFPSQKSREVGFYYGNPQNRFWKVMATLFDEPFPNTREQQKDMLLRHHIALWDVIKSCTIKGSSDESIENVEPNNMRTIANCSRIRKVFCLGEKSAQLYKRYCQDAMGVPCIQLPSTSPANAAYSCNNLIQEYQAILPYLHPSNAPILPVTEVVALEQTIDKQRTKLPDLMERAGLWLAYHTHKLQPQGSAVILCGNGNNGGDGWVAARHLKRWGHKVHLLTTKSASNLQAEPARTSAQLTAQEIPECIVINPSTEKVNKLLEDANIIIDALLGTGFAGEAIKEPFSTWICLANKQTAQENIQAQQTRTADEQANIHAQQTKQEHGQTNMHAQQTRIANEQTQQTNGQNGQTNIQAHQTSEQARKFSEAYKCSPKKNKKLSNAQKPLCIAADVPSGLNANTGTPASGTFHADITVTMICGKPGLFTQSNTPLDDNAICETGAPSKTSAMYETGAPSKTNARCETNTLLDGNAMCGKVLIAPLVYIEDLFED